MKIGVLVSGGDAPGMNKCLKELYEGITALGEEVVFVGHGYDGLVYGEVLKPKPAELEAYEKRAGAYIKSARSSAFMTPDGFKKALKTLKKHSLDALVIIGGNGSLKGAKALMREGVRVFFIPATIDNDMPETEYSLGFETAVSAGLDYIKKVMTTMEAFDKSCVFEVMGRYSGAIAEEVYNEYGADYLINSSHPLDIGALSKSVIKNKKPSLCLILQENLVDRGMLAFELETRTKRVWKADDVGYVQRGTDPVKKDLKKAKAYSALVTEAVRTHRYNTIAVTEGGKEKLVTLQKY